MRNIIYLTLIIFLVSCFNSPSQPTLNADSLLYSKKAEINGTSYRAEYYTGDKLFIVNRLRDTIVKRIGDGIDGSSIEFEDFNEDGYLDLRFGFNSNYYFEEVLLFDT